MPVADRDLGRGQGNVGALTAACNSQPQNRSAILAAALPANDGREDYLRATLSLRDGAVWAQPAPRQDSAMLKTLARAEALIVRAPHAPAAPQGSMVEILELE